MGKMEGITKAQSAVLAFIESFISTHRYSPSYMEIKTHCGFASLNAVAKHLAALKRKGFLDQTSRGQRSLNLLQPKCESDDLLLPLAGTIAAGKPLTLYPNQHHLQVPKRLAPNPENTYLLKAEGDSLQDELIADGDLLIVETQATPRVGDTVIALINELESFVMQYHLEGSFVKLVSRNVHYKPIILKSERVEIQGILLSLFRAYHAIAS